MKCILYLLQMWPNFKTVYIKAILLFHLSEESFPEKLNIAKLQAKKLQSKTTYYLGGSEDHYYQEKAWCWPC